MLQKTNEGEHISIEDPFDRSIAIAFELDPIDIFENGGRVSSSGAAAIPSIVAGEAGEAAVDLQVKVVPVVGEITSNPSSEPLKIYARK